MGWHRRPSGLEDLINVAAMLPWWVALGLALATYLGLHLWASSTEAPPQDVLALGGIAGRQIYRTLAGFLQYLIPAALMIGAALSAFKAAERRRRFDATQALGSREGLLNMTWQEFEGLVGEHFRREGYSVAEIGGNGPDGGVDLKIRKNGELFLVQCKQWRSYKVGVDVVRQLYGVMAARGAAGGFVVSSGDFTGEAQSFSADRNIALVDGPGLIRAMQASAAAASPAPARTRPANPVKAAPSCPKCRGTMVKRIAKQGPRAGASFWGCPKYPSCNGTRPL